MPRGIHSIASEHRFADALAHGVLAEFGGDMLALADVRILVPTRRAVRALHDAFLRASGGRALMLPRLQPLGDLGTGAALENAAFELPQGGLSDPVRTASGYAVLRVLEKKPFDPAAYEGQKATIVAGLKDQRRQQLFRAYLSQARQRYAVERRPEAFQRVLG